MSEEPQALREFHIVCPDDYAAHGYPHDIWTWMRREDPVYRWERTEGIPFWAITKNEPTSRVDLEASRRRS